MSPVGVGLILLSVVSILQTLEIRRMERHLARALAERRSDEARLLLIANALEGADEGRVLREAAAAYEAASNGDPEGAPYLNQLAREVYRPGGPSVPALWLVDRAEKKENRVVYRH